MTRKGKRWRRPRRVRPRANNMRAACENCGKLGEMEPGKPFVCAVCGHYHDPRVVGSRIAAEKKAADRKAEADRIARIRAEREAADRKAEAARVARIRAEREAAERAARVVRPKPAVRPIPPSHPPSPRRAVREIAREGSSGSCVGGCVSTIVKIGIAIFVFGVLVGSCLSSKRVKIIPPPVRQPSPGKSQGGATAPPSPAQTRSPVAPLPKQTSPEPKPLLQEVGSSARQKPAEKKPDWKPGTRHPKQPHVRASDTPGEWILDEGYEFVHPGTSDWTVRKVTMPSPCAKCGGTGVVKSLLKCSLCKGRKTYPVHVSEIDRRTGRPRMVTQRISCPTCNGMGGTYIDGVCPKCNGTKVSPKGRR